MQVSVHVECNVADVLDEEPAGACAQDRFGRHAPGSTETRCEVRIVGFDQPIAQTAVPCHLDVGRETNPRVFVEVTCAGADQYRMQAQVGDLSLWGIQGNNGRNLPLRRVGPRWRAFVAQAAGDREVGSKFPGVADVVGLAESREPRHGQTGRI